MTDQVDQIEESIESHEDLFNAMYGKSDEDVTPDEIPTDAGAPDDDVVEEEGQPVQDPEPEVKEAQPPQPSDPYSWIDALPEEYKGNVNRLKHEALSDRGRVSALSRKVNEMQRALEAANSRASATAQNISKAASTAKEPSDALRQLKEDYPELGSQLDEVFASERKQFEELVASRLEPIQEKFSAADRQAEERRLETAAAKIFKTEETGVHWKDIVNSEDFNAWIAQQPSFIQETARTTTSADAGLEILQMYENDYQAAMAAMQKSTPATSQPVGDTSHADQLKAQRNARKASTVSPASRPAGTDKDAISGDAEAMFNAMWGNRKSINRR